MAEGISRRLFLETTATSAAALSMMAATGQAASPSPPSGRKARIAKVYFGTEHPGWPMAAVDVAAERQRFEEQVARVLPPGGDIELVDCGLIGKEDDLPALRERLKDVDGILLLQLTMHMGKILADILDTGLPLVLFSEPFCGHEWHTIASLDRDGKRIDCYASSKFDDLATAVRPLRAIGRLKTARLLYVNKSPADPKYVAAIREKFGTEIKSLELKDLEEVYQAVPDDTAAAEAERWTSGAMKVVEPSHDDILKASRMSVALQRIVQAESAACITINCLGSGLIAKGMGYPCFGFSRLNSIGSGGICEADLKSAMTHLIFSYLVNRPGFVTDPCFDYSNNTIIHAHCVAAVKMLGQDGPEHPYIIRSHLEDNKGAVLQVKLPVGQKVCMARMIDDQAMLFSTGEAIDSPLVDRGCRTKLTVRVPHPEKFLENWSCGLHRVIFYGDHTRDIERFCKLMQIRLVREGTGQVPDVPALTWTPRVRA